MPQAAFKLKDPAPTDASEGAVLDRLHLARMTFGERDLEREILQLFDRQSELLIERIRQGSPVEVAALAHTLKGSAVGVGAVRVARAAADAERAAGAGSGECGAEIERLAQAITEARIHISALLSAR